MKYLGSITDDHHLVTKKFLEDMIKAQHGKAIDITGSDLVTYLAAGSSGFYRGCNVTNAPIVNSGNTGWWYFTIICGGSSLYATVIAQALYDESDIRFATYTNSTLSKWSNMATIEYVTAAIQSAISDSWEASY